MSKQDIKFSIQGIEQVNKILDQLPQSVNDNIQLDLHKKAAKFVKEEIANRAPAGEIKKNIVIRKAPKAKSTVWVSLTKKVFYALFLERGVSYVRKTKAGKETGSLPRTPFIEPAHDAAFPRVVKFLQENYLRLVNQAVKKQVKKINKQNAKK